MDKKWLVRLSVVGFIIWVVLGIKCMFYGMTATVGWGALIVLLITQISLIIERTKNNT